MIETVPEPTTGPTTPDTHTPTTDTHHTLDVDALLAWGAAHRTPAVRTLAERASKALTGLAERRERQDAVHAAQRRVIDAELLLAQAQRDLRAAKAGTPTVPTASTNACPAVPDPDPAQRREEGRRARVWAAANKVACPDRGVVPKGVLVGYRRANEGEIVGVVR
ncbi:hypothetical protein [Embleya hyalina]|uniref:Uncharacterized protein n=1 Tax=Embleya hyalina TaxID=516124 RepID=A0A401YYS9_9ACTN|nr:hypothetical protein [Embleya hyalina]GCD99751.1 hypothetical protein EHYA_07473 [Embleya hyalina]